MSLYKTVPATAANPRTIAEALAMHEADASRVLKDGSDDDKARAALRLQCVQACRAALGRGDADLAAWHAYVLAEVYGREVVDTLEKPVRHVARLHKRQRENKGRGLAQAILAAVEREHKASPRASGKALWQRLVSRTSDPDGFMMNGHTITRGTGDSLVQIAASGAQRTVTRKTFENRYAPPRRK